MSRARLLVSLTVVLAVGVFGSAPAATAATAPLPLNSSTSVTIADGATADYTFTGVVGSRLTLQFTKQVVNVDPYFGRGRIRLYQPDGTLFGTDDLTADPDQYTLPEFAPLPSAGTWSVVIDPDPGVSGSWTFIPRLTADQKIALKVGTKVTSEISLPGQQVRYAFAGIKGRRVAVDASATNWRSLSDPEHEINFGKLSLVRPNGTVAAQFLPRNGTNWLAGRDWAEPFEIDTLDATGTWTVVVDPDHDSLGTQTLTLNQITDQTGGTFTLGKAQKVTISTPGQQAIYSFSWNGKGSLPWSVTGSTWAGAWLSFVSPTGAVDGPTSFVAGNTTWSFAGNGESGIWKAVVDPQSWYTGSATIKLG